jgi:hypothetical protein
MSPSLRPMLERLVDKVSRMRPIPPTDNLFDSSWEKVDQLLMKTMKYMKDKGVERPLRPLSEELFGMALESPIVPGKPVPRSQAVQAVAYRAMDNRLLVDEFQRMRAEARAIRDVAQGKDVEVPFMDFPPASPARVPPCFVDRGVYNNSAAGVVGTFGDELRRRGLIPKPQPKE